MSVSYSYCCWAPYLKSLLSPLVWIIRKHIAKIIIPISLANILGDAEVYGKYPQGLHSVWHSQLQESLPIHKATYLSLYDNFSFLEPCDINLLHSKLIYLW